MRVDVKKFLFFGVESQRKAFFEEAQELGIVHFINENKVPITVPEEIQHFQQAIKVLRGQPPVKQDESKDYTHASGIVDKILANHSILHKNEEEERVLKLEISRMEPLGDFSIEDLNFIQQEGKRVVQFYYSEEGVVKQETLPEDVIFLGSAHNLDYFMGIRKEPAQYNKMYEIKVDRTLDQLKSRVEEIHKENGTAHSELKGLAKYDEFLHHALVDLLNKAQLHDVQHYVQYTLDE